MDDLVIALFGLIVIALAVRHFWNKKHERSGKRCWNCGTKAPPNADDSWLCPNCGEWIEADESE